MQLSNHTRCIVSALLFTALLSACTNQQVAVPKDPAQDAPPVVTITNIVEQGSIDPPFSTSIVGQNVVPNPYYNPQRATCAPNTQILFVITSNSPHGVKDLSVIIKQLNGLTLFHNSISHGLDANGLAPNQLSITTGNQAGNPVLLVTVQPSQQAIFVEVDSHNFNNQETHFVGEYIPK